MGMKKILCIFATVSIALLSVLNVYAAETRESFAGISVNMPDVIAELKGFDYDTSDLSALNVSFGDEKLSVEDFHKYNPEQDSAKVYMLVDISQSAMDYLPKIKEFMKLFASRMGKNDSVSIISFGSKVENLIDGTNNLDDINSVIDSIECNDEYTMLYDALDSVYQTSASTIDNYTRKYAVAFTDCQNDKLVSVSEKEVAEKYSTHQLPLYVCAPSTAQKNDLQALGEIARSSGGDISDVDSEDDFLSFTNQIDEVTVLKLKAENNTAQGDEKNLSVTINNETVYNINITVSNSVADTTAPEVKSAEYDGKNNRFIIEFSEKVSNITNSGAYTVTDENGKKWSVTSVEALPESIEVQLLMTEQITNGKYTIKFNGITDCSKEKNPLEDTAEIKVSGMQVQQDNDADDFSVSTIVIIAISVIVVLGIIAAVIVFSMSGKRKEEDKYDFNPQVESKVNSTINGYESSVHNVVKHHIKNDNAIRVRIKIKTGKTSEQNIETGIESSVIVGRSSVCDIYIDDAKLSRQHFAIENRNKELYISDLNSKNGTFLNGIRISSRRKILNGDKILAGLSEISIYIAE